MKIESFRTCLLFPSLLLLERLVLGHSTSGNNTMTSDRLQLFANMVPSEEAYDFKEKGVGRNRLFTKYFFIAFSHVLLESNTRKDLQYLACG